MKTLLVLMLAAKALTPDVCNYAGMFAATKVATNGASMDSYNPSGVSHEELGAAHYRLRQALKHLPPDEPFRSCFKGWVLYDLKTIEEEKHHATYSDQQDDAREFLRSRGEVQ